MKKQKGPHNAAMYISLVLSLLLSLASTASISRAQDDEGLDEGDATDQTKADAIAGAGDTAPAAPAPATDAAMNVEPSSAADVPAVPGGYWGAFVGTSPLPSAGSPKSGDPVGGQLFVFRTFNPGILIGAGINFSYFGDGLPSSQQAAGAAAAAGAPAPKIDKFGAGFMLHGEYWLYNKNRFMIGPELTYMNQLAPSSASFKNHVIAPGLVFWYVPWEVPIAIGAAWDLAIVKNEGEKVIIQTQTPGLRLAFGLFK